MTKKSNVHPDHYKTAGRDRPDDAAAARLNRAIVAKSASQELPDRMAKEFYFERPEPAGRAADRAKKEAPSRAGTAGKSSKGKAPAPGRTVPERKPASTRKPVTKRK